LTLRWRPERDYPVQRVLIGQRVGVLEETTLPLHRRGQVDREFDGRALEVPGYAVVRHRGGQILLAVDHGSA
jgi:hypothetical protein